MARDLGVRVCGRCPYSLVLKSEQGMISTLRLASTFIMWSHSGASVFLRGPGTIIRAVLLVIGLPALLIGLYLYVKRSRTLGRSISLGASLRRMSRRRAVAIALIFLVCGLTMEFVPESLALLWHIRHGRMATFANSDGRFEIPVPTWWFVWDSGDPSSLMLVTGSGRFRGTYLKRSGWGSATFYRRRFPSQADRQKILSQLDERHRKSFSRSDAQVDAQMDDLFGPSRLISKLSVAGQPTECFERINPRSATFVLVDCEPEAPTPGLSVLFSGHPSTVPEFLRLLQLVRRKS
jgi:hypothetical protein